jgi:hypothetical protein
LEIGPAQDRAQEDWTPFLLASNKKKSSPAKIHTTNGRIIAGIKQVALRPINVLLELVGHGGRESSAWLFL